MNLEVRLLIRPDGHAEFVLTDDKGVMLPMQLGIDIFQSIEEDTEIVAKFVVDGERVRLTNNAAILPVDPDAVLAGSDSTVVPLKRGKKPH